MTSPTVLLPHSTKGHRSMTYSEPIISRMRVESFRGFRDAREFDLSAASVVVTGPNGTGKTSFFDALQWGLLGSLERLETLRARRNTEHVVNQYRLGRKASVEIDLMLPSGQVTIRRTGDQGGSTLELRTSGQDPIFGVEAEGALRGLLLPESEVTLESALATSGLMQQDVMRRVLEAKPADRYRQLSTVLGLGALEDFEDAAKSVAKLASDREKSARAERERLAGALAQARVRWEAARAKLAARPQVAAISAEVAATLAAVPVGIHFVGTGLTFDNPDAVRATAAAFAETIDAVDAALGLSRKAVELSIDLANEPSEEQLTALRAEADRAEATRGAAETTCEVVQGQLNAARQAAADVAQLAALAVPLLSDDCPVCGQSIDREHVERELRERAEATGAILELEQTLVRVTGELSDAAGAAEAAREIRDSAERRAGQWRQAREAERVADAAVSALAEDVRVVRFDQYTLESFVVAAGPALEYFRRARRALIDLLDTFDRQSDQGVINRADAEVKSLKVALKSAEAVLVAESARSQKLQTLSEQTLEARVEVTEARLRSMQPLVANIFQRLDPHPAFKTVEFELATYYRRGTTSPLVIDQVENVSADPLLIFSTSQANIVALSYFIAMSLSSGERGLPFLLLDDPVQSMDDVNVLGFADLCRHLRLRRQLIVSTHERRFASLLERKLAPRDGDSRTKMIRFTGWDRSGPTVEESTVDAQLLDDPIRLVRVAG
ncbi:AAA family ATPase [Janibacter indicus]|uniref:Nuclease SbcCD subunit C n=1 Tax=Janibacter indicus TaxID=857417 RepID=A0A1W1Y4S4_9MICO|nr:AAA family ATPase [Janibacter indicus]SMC31134.1 RecF/RecN/SMC N terminal domain-containing protein [Janibacter indicus]